MLKDNLEVTVAKIKSTMCNCGATTIPEFHKIARLTHPIVISFATLTASGFISSSL